MQKPQQKTTIKKLLLDKNRWWNFYEKRSSKIRNGILVSIVKLLSCRNTIRGYQLHCCLPCNQTKCIPHTCKSRACSSCGKKATSIWISQQASMLPHMSFQHITFTMPSALWDLFWVHRHLLTSISTLAAQCVKTANSNPKSTLAIFTALHTFGRNLKRNVHVHLSVGLQALSSDNSKLVNVSFYPKTLMKLWRYRVLTLISDAIQHSSESLPQSFLTALNRLKMSKDQFIHHLHNSYWHIYCQKPSNKPQKDIEYFGRYVKRPPIAESKLRHYDGTNIAFSYLDHTSKSYRTFRCSVDAFIARFIQHIPDVGFRLIRYYGILSNRLRSTLLTVLFNLLDQNQPPLQQPPSFTDLLFDNFGVNPLLCPICNNMMRLSYSCFASTSVFTLLLNHKSLATSTC